MKRIILLIIINTLTNNIIAMQQPEEQETITIALGKNKYVLPKSVALQADTIKHFKEDLALGNEIELSSAYLTPAIMHYVADIMRAFYNNRNLQGKALLDAVQKEIEAQAYKNPLSLFWALIDPNAFKHHYNLLKAMNYLDFKPGIEFVARTIASQPNVLKIMDQELPGLGDLKPYIARWHYLLTGTKLPNIPESSYGFSVQDYLDYRPEVLAKRRFVAEHNRDTLELFKLQLNSLDGLNNIPAIERVNSLTLSHNNLTQLTAGSFKKLNQLNWLDISNNRQLTYIEPGVFQGLKELGSLLMAHNYQLRHIAPEVFKDLPKTLNWLQFSHSKLAELDPSIFHHLNNLSILCITGNPLSDENKQNIKKSVGPRTSLWE